MTILITNDDGIHAAGLLALYSSLRQLGTVTAIAPERPRSACGHAITLHKPLRLRAVEMPDGETGYASNGTPADCIALGVSSHVGGVPDLVVSGINLGPNLGVDMTYSGTVAAATEAAICGIPSFAISVASYEKADFGPAAEFARYLAEQIGEHGLQQASFLNVNVPAVPRTEIRGVTVTRQGRARYSNRIERRTDPRGGAYYWLTGERVDPSKQPGGDADAISHQTVSVTPVRLDLTDEALMDELSGWELDWPG
jgi:5'-nucleotidase